MYELKPETRNVECFYTIYGLNLCSNLLQPCSIFSQSYFFILMTLTIFSATSGTFYIIEDVKVELDAKFNLEIWNFVFQAKLLGPYLFFSPSSWVEPVSSILDYILKVNSVFQWVGMASLNLEKILNSVLPLKE